MMGITNDYEAFCFDEVAFVLYAAASDDKGKLNWNKINWAEELEVNNIEANSMGPLLTNKATTNKEFVDFAKQFS